LNVAPEVDVLPQKSALNAREWVGRAQRRIVVREACSAAEIAERKSLVCFRADPDFRPLPWLEARIEGHAPAFAARVLGETVPPLIGIAEGRRILRGERRLRMDRKILHVRRKRVGGHGVPAGVVARQPVTDPEPGLRERETGIDVRSGPGKSGIMT